jgi:hypothetical protein
MRVFAGYVAVTLGCVAVVSAVQIFNDKPRHEGRVT